MKFIVFVLFTYSLHTVIAEPKDDDVTVDDQTPSKFKEFRRIDEFMHELQQNFPSNSFANIRAGENSDEGSGVQVPVVVGSFGPESNFSVAGSHDMEVQAVGSSLPQADDSERYSDPEAILEHHSNSSLQILGGENSDRGKRGALDLAQIMKCATGCDPLLFKGYGCFCGYLGSGEPVDGIDTCCKMHDWCYTTSSCMGLDYDLPYFVPFKWKCNGGAPYCIPGKSAKNGRNSCSHQLCECDREFAMCLKRHLPCPTSKAVCKKSPQRMVQNVVMGMGSGHGYHNPKPSVYQAVPRYDSRRPNALPYLNFG